MGKRKTEVAKASLKAVKKNELAGVNQESTDQQICTKDKLFETKYWNESGIGFGYHESWT